MRIFCCRRPGFRALWHHFVGFKIIKFTFCPKEPTNSTKAWQVQEIPSYCLWMCLFSLADENHRHVRMWFWFVLIPGLRGALVVPKGVTQKLWSNTMGWASDCNCLVVVGVVRLESCVTQMWQGMWCHIRYEVKWCYKIERDDIWCDYVIEDCVWVAFFRLQYHTSQPAWIAKHSFYIANKLRQMLGDQFARGQFREIFVGDILNCQSPTQASQAVFLTFSRFVSCCRWRQPEKSDAFLQEEVGFGCFEQLFRCWMVSPAITCQGAACIQIKVEEATTSRHPCKEALKFFKLGHKGWTWDFEV